MKPASKMNYQKQYNSPSGSALVSIPPGQRYKRVRAIPWMQLEKLQNCLPVVVGAGMNGSQVVLHLTTLGVKRMMIVDPDHVSISDLGKSLYTEYDAKEKRLKVDALKNMVYRVNSEIELFLYPVSFSKFPKNVVLDYLKKGVHVVPIICVDNRQSLCQAVQFFNILGISCYCGFLTAVELKSQVYVLRPDSGCFACAFNQDDFNMFETKLSCTGKRNAESGVPALYPTAAQCASMIVYEIMRDIMPDLAKPINHSYKITQSLLGGTELIPMIQSEECTFHYPVISGVLDVPTSWPLTAVFQAAAKRLNVREDEVEIHFDFQNSVFHITGRCPKCLKRFPVGRLDLDMKKCPRCGSRLKALKNQTGLAKADSSATLIPDCHQSTIVLNDLDDELRTKTLRELPWIENDVMLCSTSTRSQTLLLRGRAKRSH